jgi:hypothetical protein
MRPSPRDGRCIPVKDREARAATAARLQMLASQLVQDLRDLRNGLALEEPEERTRLEALRELAEGAIRGTSPAFHDREGSVRGGSLTPERSKRLAQLDEDEELYALVSTLRGQPDPDSVRDWSASVLLVVDGLLDHGWKDLAPENKSFIEHDLETFLERMERLDESELYVRRRRPTLAKS